MINWLINKLNKKALSSVAKVELSIGVVYLKPLTNGIVNKCRVKSCIFNDTINAPLFFQLMDYELSGISKSKIDSLSISDGNKLRDGVRDILIKNKVIKIEGTNDPEGLSASEVRKMEEMKLQSKADLDKLFQETGEQVGVANG